MTTLYYPARICEDDGSYLFQAIDIPGAISAGDDPADAFAHGTEALQLALDTWNEKLDGPLPKPTPLREAIDKLDAEQREGLVAIQLVPVVLAEPTVKINVTMPGDVVKRIDAVAGNYGRSGYITEAVRERLAGRRPSSA